LHAAQVVTELLKAAGITVGGAAGEGRAPAGSIEIGNVESPPMSEVVGEMLRESDNTTAELLTKELGWKAAGEGTTAAGLSAVTAALGESGLAADQYRSVDGSGLDRSDRATCGLLVDAVARAGPDGPIAAGLPVAGQTGTLSQRFGGSPAYGRLRAKTGALQGVAALSGWMAVPDGRQLVFAMLANGLPNEAAGRLLQERLGAALATYPEGPKPEELAPGAS
jgi:D-alanyl-D-alanine carboxypeptidase/D-alanyl-D-alanine-endopeptidase (penicillin-binding protein 4)